MQEMKDFCLWFLENLPTFLMAEPFKYFVGMAFLLATLAVILQIMRLR